MFLGGLLSSPDFLSPQSHLTSASFRSLLPSRLFSWPGPHPAAIPPHLPAWWWSPASNLLHSSQGSLLPPTAAACPRYPPQPPGPARSPRARSARSWEPASHHCSKFLRGAHKQASLDLGLPLCSLCFYQKSSASRPPLKCLETGLLSASCFCRALVFTWGGDFSPGLGCSEVTGRACPLAHVDSTRFVQIQVRSAFACSI